MARQREQHPAEATPPRVVRTVGAPPDQQIRVTEDHSHATATGAAAAGAITGGVVGLAAGPLGVAAGAVGGAIVGVVAEQVLHAGAGADAHAGDHAAAEAIKAVPHDLTHIPEMGYGAAGGTIGGDVPMRTGEYDQRRAAEARPGERMP